MRASAEAEVPFVAVHTGRYARIVLAELLGQDGRPQLRFAWKLRVDQVETTPAVATNGELDRQWQQERVQLASVRAANVVAPVAVPAALTQSPPVFYCQRIDRYFHPVCPSTGAVLSVCRDDARLLEAGLPGYEHDTVRYLHHGQEQGPLTFYHVDGLVPDPANDAARVESQAELVQAWSALVHGSVEASELPCQTCEHRHECYPKSAAANATQASETLASETLAAETLADEIPAEQHLHAVSFYDVDSFALELASTDFEMAMVRLGGGEHEAASQWPPGTRVWMGGADPERRTLEILRLKLAAFADICRGVHAVHDTGRPHLGISPANLVAFDTAVGSALPINWQLRFALTDLGGAIPVTVPGTGETLWQPGREVSEDATSRLFLAPSLRSLEGGSVTMSVACRQVSDAAGDAHLVVDVHRAGVPPFVLPGDLLIVQPVADGVPRSARIDEVGTRWLVATVLVEPDRAEEVGSSLAWAGTSFEARLSFVRRSSPSADLYGLGMLLLRVLLVHDEQSLAEVAATVERCLRQMAGSVQAEGEDLAVRWQQILDGDLGEGRFAPWHLLQLRSDRQAVFDSELQGNTMVPVTIWRSLMALAGKLLLAPPVSRADAAGVNPSPMQGVLAEVSMIERQLHVELFDRPSRETALIAACTQRAVSLRAELAAQPLSMTTMVSPESPVQPVSDESKPTVADLPDSPPVDARGFVLAVGRIGESTIEQHHFLQERVTIGRREGDNLLQLPDPMVSSKHAVIEYDAGEYVLFDCGSTNGTEVDGIRLPVEVPHPLDDGSVVHIRPFVLSFRRAEPAATATAVTTLLDDQQLYDRLCVAYAEHAGRTAREVQIGLTVVLDRACQTAGRTQLLLRLEAVQRRYLGGAGPSDQPDGDESSLAATALRAVRQLSRNLVGGDELATAEQLQEFAGRVQRFVETTSAWIEETLEWRRVLGRQLDLKATGTGSGRPSLRTAQEIRADVLLPTGDDAAVDASYSLARFLDDVLAILEGLLRGNQQVRRAVRERLDPERLVEAAGREARLRILVQAAAGSALWKLYAETFRELTAGDEHEAELDLLLQRSAERREGRQ